MRPVVEHLARQIAAVVDRCRVTHPDLTVAETIAALDQVERTLIDPLVREPEQRTRTKRQR